MKSVYCSVDNLCAVKEWQHREAAVPLSSTIKADWRVLGTYFMIAVTQHVFASEKGPNIKPFESSGRRDRIGLFISAFLRCFQPLDDVRQLCLKILKRNKFSLKTWKQCKRTEGGAIITLHLCQVHSANTDNRNVLHKVFMYNNENVLKWGREAGLVEGVKSEACRTSSLPAFSRMRTLLWRKKENCRGKSIILAMVIISRNPLDIGLQAV